MLARGFARGEGVSGAQGWYRLGGRPVLLNGVVYCVVASIQGCQRSSLLAKQSAATSWISRPLLSTSRMPAFWLVFVGVSNDSILKAAGHLSSKPVHATLLTDACVKPHALSSSWVSSTHALSIGVHFTQLKSCVAKIQCGCHIIVMIGDSVAMAEVSSAIMAPLLPQQWS